MRDGRNCVKAVECGEGDSFERHGADARLGLRAPEPALAEATADVGDSRVPIDVALLERDPFPRSHSGGRGASKRRKLCGRCSRGRSSGGCSRSIRPSRRHSRSHSYSPTLPPSRKTSAKAQSSYSSRDECAFASYRSAADDHDAPRRCLFCNSATTGGYETGTSDRALAGMRGRGDHATSARFAGET